MHFYTPNSMTVCIQGKLKFLTHLPLVSVWEICSAPAGLLRQTEAVQTAIQEAHLVTFSCQYAYFLGSIHFLFLGHFTHFIKPHFKCQWFH